MEQRLHRELFICSWDWCGEGHAQSTDGALYGDRAELGQSSPPHPRPGPAEALGERRLGGPGSVLCSASGTGPARSRGPC